MKKRFLLILVLVLCSAASVVIADSAVVYFSCTGTTEKIAGWVAEDTGADLFRILPKEPYTEEDLKYYTDCRADQEQADDAARPEISNLPEKLSEYDVVFLGYPIWHGKAPKIMYTLLESLDFSGKIIIPFCTSASSGMGSSATLLKALTGNTTTWLDGKRFAKTAEHAEVSSWVGTLELPVWSEKVYIRINNASVSATLEDNPSAKAFYQLLKQGNITIEMEDYGNFEKVGPLGKKIVQSDEKITTVPGDIILYQGDKVTVYYAENTYTFTKLGHIDGATAENTRAFLGDGNPVVEFSAEPFTKDEDTGNTETENPDQGSQEPENQGQDQQGTEKPDLPKRTGWVDTDTGWVYLKDDGTKATGWLKSGDRWYYMNTDGFMQTGWVSDGGTWYHMNSSGAMETGWVSDGGAWYYMKSSGAMHTGWLQIGDAWYYLKSSGRMATGWSLIGDKWYYFQPGGRMATGWLSDKGEWYYLEPTGGMAAGWLSDKGAWYYLESSGRMVTGWKNIYGSWYYFRDSGKMLTGWFEDKKAEYNLPENQRIALWYWFDESGRMAKGWKEINSQWEMFDEKNGQWLYTWDGN